VIPLKLSNINQKLMSATQFQCLLVWVQSSCSAGLLIPSLWHYLKANFKSSDAEVSMLFHSIHSTNISESHFAALHSVHFIINYVF